MTPMRILFAVLTLCVCGGCSDNRSDTTAARKVTAQQPTGPLLFQPTFHFADGETTQQGTGFFIKRESGQAVGVTSAHFLDFEGPKMMAAEWLTIPEENSVAKFKYSLGSPGNGGRDEPIDLRSDYFLLVDEGVPEAIVSLKLDDRIKPDVGERVWFPNKNWDALEGHTFVGGTVMESVSEYSLVVLDEDVEMQSQSGSPILSQQTGKVVGTLSRAGWWDDGSTALLLCPSHAIARVLAGNPETTSLEDAVGGHRQP